MDENLYFHCNTPGPNRALEQQPTSSAIDEIQGRREDGEAILQGKPMSMVQ
jgi:hypothetical protein